MKVSGSYTFGGIEIKLTNDGCRSGTLHQRRQCANRLWTRLRKGPGQTAVQDELSILTKRFQPVPRKVHHKVKTPFSIRIA